MKKIFRSFDLAVILAAILVAGATIGFGQDPCADTAGQDALSGKIRELFPKIKTDLPSLKAIVESGKQYTEKYGACTSDAIKEFNTYLSTNLPNWEKSAKALDLAATQKPYIDKFNNGLKAKNWDDVYSAGKDLIEKWPDQFRTVELVLGTIGYDETAKTPRNTKYNDDTLRYAKASLADLQSGKTFDSLGVAPYDYKTKNDAIAWMNYYIGYILAVDKKDKKEAINYFYTATQIQSGPAKEPFGYEVMALNYIDEVNRLTDVVKAKRALLSETDPEDVQKQKVDDVKAAVAQVNGAAERALDALARAYSFAPSDEKNKAYKDKIYKSIQDVYTLRFGKQEGLQAWIAAAPSKPLPNPSTPIAPVFDAEPAPAAAGTTTSGAATTPAAAKPAGTTTTSKPDAAIPAKPAAKPAAAAAKPQTGMKTVAKKKKGA
jgi:hypothetical protein